MLLQVCNFSTLLNNFVILEILNANFSPKNINKQNWVNINSYIETDFNYGDQAIQGLPEKISFFEEIIAWLAEELTDTEGGKLGGESEDGKVTEIVIDPPFVIPEDEVIDYVIDPPFVPSDNFQV